MVESNLEWEDEEPPVDWKRKFDELRAAVRAGWWDGHDGLPDEEEPCLYFEPDDAQRVVELCKEEIDDESGP